MTWRQRQQRTLNLWTAEELDALRVRYYFARLAAILFGFAALFEAGWIIKHTGGF